MVNMSVLARIYLMKMNKCCVKYCLELSAMILVGVVIRSDDDTVAEFAAREGLLGFLTVRDTVEFNENLKDKQMLYNCGIKH